MNTKDEELETAQRIAERYGFKLVPADPVPPAGTFPYQIIRDRACKVSVTVYAATPEAAVNALESGAVTGPWSLLTDAPGRHADGVDVVVPDGAPHATCITCIHHTGYSGPDVTYGSDPYNHEINGDATPVWECASCRHESA